MTARARKVLWPTFLVLLLALCPFIGGETLNYAEVLAPGSVAHRIFFELRLPRFLLAALTGGALAVLGGAYQILFHNPLAEPYVLGISSAVTLGVAAGEIVLHFAPYSWPGATLGFTAAMVAALGLVVLSARGSLDRLVLFGMGLNFVLSSLLFLVLSYHFQQMGGGSMRWLFGQIPWATPREALLFAAVTLPFLLGIVILARPLDALGLGDSVARTLGYHPERTRGFLLFWTSAYLSVVVCFTGAIGFVGLVVPHAVRLVLRPSSARQLIAHAFLLGALFVALSDGIARAILPPFEFPIGIITTLLGGPIFLGLLWKQRS